MGRKKRKKQSKPQDTPRGFKLRHALRRGNGVIHRMAWSPDGRIIAAPSGDGMIYLWEAESGKLLSVFRGHAGAVWEVSWSPDQKALASGGLDGTVKIWNLETAQPSLSLKVFNFHSGVAWSPHMVFSTVSSRFWMLEQEGS
jgi:WD40 repeat protein